MFTIENSHLSVVISAKGAELQRLYNKILKLDYLWDANPAFWGKHSPVLFPIVGELKEGRYFYNDKAYALSRHGFAREMDFEVTAQSPTGISFSLASTGDTLAKYPFDFRFEVKYELSDNSLKTTYRVTNTGERAMYFSVGGHPAFRVPLTADTSYEDYYLEFNHPEHAGRWPISKEGLIEEKPVELLNQTDRLPLSKTLFAKDALVFKGLASNSVALKSDKHNHGLLFDFTGFPYLGIWAAKNADFVCIEPWCGIADSVHSQQQLTNKEGIQVLQPAKNFARSWSVTLF
ncbi:MAG TPA: aldose 1-epimerase family protein [Chitinophagaceae bacterium]|nr:aldose 1-epimerase family protein [Chitinophagaceae bacterium]